jgi:transposase-like protein
MEVCKVVKWLEEQKIFRRKRNSNWKRARGICMYHEGLSYRKASRLLGVSSTTVRNWFLKGQKFFLELKPKIRKRVAVDEKELKVNNRTVYLWAAVDLENEVPIAIDVSYGRSGFEALRFVRKIEVRCKNKPRCFIDSGKWYPWALTTRKFKFNIMSFGPRSAVERFLSIIDWRIRRFWERFPRPSSLRSLVRWIEAFAGIYVLLNKT